MWLRYYFLFVLISPFTHALQCWNGIRYPAGVLQVSPVYCTSSNYCVKIVNVVINGVTGTFYGCAGGQANGSYPLPACYVSIK